MCLCVPEGESEDFEEEEEEDEEDVVAEDDDDDDESGDDEVSRGIFAAAVYLLFSVVVESLVDQWETVLTELRV